MDGAVLGSSDIAVRKAKTAALFQVESEAVWEYCKPGAPAPGLEQTNGGLAPFGGGLPLKQPDGTVIGAIDEMWNASYTQFDGMDGRSATDFQGVFDTYSSTSTYDLRTADCAY